MRVAGSGEGTHWHECNACNQPCDGVEKFVCVHCGDEAMRNSRFCSERCIDRWGARLLKIKLACIALCLCASVVHAQRGTLEFVKYDFADRLTWVNGSNAWPVYTEVQGQAGDKVWRTVATVRDAQSITIPRDARTVRYRVRHVYFVGGAASTWCYKSTK